MANVGDHNYHLASLNLFNEDDGPMITVAGAPGVKLTGSAQANHEAVGRLLEAALPRYMAAWEAELTPIPMVLHCPLCGVQHIDEPSEGWDNPPHRSHQCQHCNCVWRPADVPTTGVLSVQTEGKADSWRPLPGKLGGREFICRCGHRVDAPKQGEPSF